MASEKQRSRGNADEISVVEAAYRLGGSESEWLQRLMNAASPLLDQGWGMTASTWQTVGDSRGPRTVTAKGGPDGFPDAVMHALKNTRQDIQVRLFHAAPVTSLGASGTAASIAKDSASQALLGLGVRDCLTIFGSDPGGYALALQAYWPTVMRPTQGIVSRWNRVASHFSSAFRLRRGIEALGATTAPVNMVSSDGAILSPGGHVEHAEGAAVAARKALARGVIAMDQARGKLRSQNLDGALDAWKALIAGRWTLLDRVDTDGKRFLVARKNDADAIGPAGLSARECHVMSARARGLALKLIAYDVGLSIAVVARTLRIGMAKLGLKHEAELVALFSHGSRESSQELR